MNFRKISLAQIFVPERNVRITFGDPPEQLENSIREIGVLNPIHVRPQNDRFAVVLGFSRFKILSKLGAEKTEGRIVSSATQDRDYFLINIYDNLSQREFQPLEKAVILEKAGHFFTEEDVIQKIMPVIGMNPSAKNYRRFVKLMSLPPQALNDLREGRFNLKNATYLLRFSPDEQKSIVDFLNKLLIGVNLRKEIMENLYECSRREGCSASEIIRSPEINVLLKQKKSLKEKVENIRGFLRKKRYPRLSEAEQKFDDFRSSLKTPPQISIQAPPFFENRDYKVTVRFQNPDELRDRLNKLTEMMSSEKNVSRFENIMNTSIDE